MKKSIYHRKSLCYLTPISTQKTITFVCFAESISWIKVATEMTKPPKYCIYEGKARELNERWQPSDCVSCVCQEDGMVSCQESMCKSCENAIPPDPGECCPHCPPLTNTTFLRSEIPCQTSLDGCELTCEHGYAKDESNCPICSCDTSEVRIGRINILVIVFRCIFINIEEIVHSVFQL